MVPETKLESLAADVGALLKLRGLRIATAESCTGGGLSYYLTSVPGCSLWFDRGFVTYSNDAKTQMLDVQVSTLKQFGAVSSETAREMALGAFRNSDAKVCISITGIAGPGGGTPDKPVGSVWVGFLYDKKNISTELLQLRGSRKEVRLETIQFVFESLLRDLS